MVLLDESGFIVQFHLKQLMNETNISDFYVVVGCGKRIDRNVGWTEVTFPSVAP